MPLFFPPAASRKTVAGFLSAAVLAVFVVAGWWPFHVPRNGVSWIRNGPGLRLRAPATLWSRGTFGTGHVLRTIELWAQPDRSDGHGAVLAFQKHPAERFILSQAHSDMELEWPADRNRRHYLSVSGIFHPGRRVLITLVSGKDRLAVYVDGALEKTYRSFPFAGSELTGRVIVGSTPSSDDCWSGELFELALFDRELSAQEIRNRFLQSVSAGAPQHSAPERGILALYPFNEGAGTVVRDNGSHRFDLVMPERFQVLDPAFLHPFWRQDFRFNSGFWEDVLLNVFGFIPFGFIVCAYLAETRPISQAVWMALLFGFVVSLTIESVQIFLPTRSSDSRDLLTNVMGTILGVAAYRYRPLRSLYERFADAVIERTSRHLPAPARTLPATGVEVPPDVASD